MSTDMLDPRSVGRNVGAIVTVFALTGFGLGVTGLLTVLSIKGQASGGDGALLGPLVVGVVFLQNTYTTFLLGTVVAAFTGLVTGYASEEPLPAALGGAVGSGLGYYIMATVSVLLPALALGGEGGGFGELGNYLLPLVGAGFPVTIVALVSAYVGVVLGGTAGLSLLE